MDEETLNIVKILGALGGVLGISYYRKNNLLKKRKIRRMWVQDIYQQRNEKGFYQNLIQELRLSNPTLYFNFTRMTSNSFDKLLNICGQSLLKHSQRVPISPEQRLMVTLRFLATGDSYPSLAYAFRIAPPTICNIVRETCNIIWEKLAPIYIKTPTEDQWLQIEKGFYNLWQIPNCIGALDGKHIRIRAPASTGSIYFNYKKYFSIILLAVCDARYFFTYVDIGAYGSQSDGGVLKNSNFGIKLKNRELQIPNSKTLPGTHTKAPFYLVGDEGFPLQLNLLRPYSKRRGGNMPEDESIFNYRLSRARRTIENSFGILVARFRIFHREINGNPETIESIVKAALCLHNFIKSEKNPMYCDTNFLDREVNGTLVPGEWRKEVPLNCAFEDPGFRFGNRNAARVAWEFRDSLKEYFYSGVGSGLCPWQLDYIRNTGAVNENPIFV